MAIKDNSNARGVHVSPGVYSREVDLTYAVKSLGITTLGVVGETQRGPAFQPTLVEDWREFTSVFGGTNPEKFRGSQYPKYELPYIAKSYLSESKQLQVCRVLGIGGYNAGPAWLVTAKLKTPSNDGHKKVAIAVIRSRGTYEPFRRRKITTSADCECATDSYDTLTFDVGEWTNNGDCDTPKTYNMDALGIAPYTPLYATGNECIDYYLKNGEAAMEVSATNHGRFKIIGFTGAKSKPNENIDTMPESAKTGFDATSYYYGGKEEPTGEDVNADRFTDDTSYFEYPVSLNPADKEYILRVLGTNPNDADAPVYVESLYDVALTQLINNDEVDKISLELTPYNVFYAADYCGLEPVYDLMTESEETLSRKDVGKRFIATSESTGITTHPYDYKTNKPLTNIFGNMTTQQVADMVAGDDCEYPDYLSPDTIVTVTNAEEKKTVRGYWRDVTCDDEDVIENVYLYQDYKVTDVAENAIPGYIYTVVQSTDVSGKRHYYYRRYVEDSVVKEWERQSKDVSAFTESAFNMYPILDRVITYDTAESAMSRTVEASASSEDKMDVAKDKSKNAYKTVLVYNNADGMYYTLVTLKNDNDVSYDEVVPVECDLNDYKSAYRYSSTPWIVSNIKGDYNKFELNRLFRFHTISDGDASVNEVKVSIENIRPDEGVFDVVVRAINDTDYSPMVLEKYSRCGLIPGERNYIALMIGSFDGAYESKSKYITVEVNENTATKNSVPAGFMGYPIPKYDGAMVDGKRPGEDTIMPPLKYNLNYDQDIKNKKQYFGLSDLVGVDVDAFTYKGRMAYIDSPEFKTPGFHLDSRINDEAYLGEHYPELTVDGEKGYKFEAVSTNNRTAVLTETPVIGKETEMAGSIYEYVNLRKFTVYFYGGFDGWDVYRPQRSNTDGFKLSKYMGQYDEYSGEGFAFNRIQDPESLGLNQNGITSDWYAYLAGIRQFANPEAVDINVFATPGIDYVNNKLLVEEAIEMVEEERADSIYVVTTPDKPMGAGDYYDELYTPEEAVYNLEDTEIDSNYTCTYYPWVKYYDNDNNQYIYLPATKDVVRNMAMTDNTTYPWFAPAGIGRGSVDCVRARFITKIGEEDDLYNGRINPVKTFSSEGVKLWGQKNLQVAESQLNRIAVRRLLLRMRKLISIACLNLIFDPNDPTVEKTFLSTVKPIMDNIKANRGISDYRIEVHSTVESRERRELPAKIFFKPYNALEYVVLDFVLTPESVSFDSI